jgi:hypothetical protein
MNETTEKTSLAPIPHGEEKRLEVAKMLVAVGNMRVVAENTGVPYRTITTWVRSDWWPQVLEQAKQEQRSELQSRLGKIANHALAVVEDRLENGEYILNNKTGELVRKPVGLRDANTAVNNVLNQFFKIEDMSGKDTKTDETVQDVLKQLAGEFAKFNRAQKTKDVVDVKFKEV